LHADIHYPLGAGFFDARGWRISRFIVAYVTVLAMLSIIGYYYAGASSNKPDHAPSARSDNYFSTDLAFFDLPSITLNLGGEDGTSHIDLDVSLEVAKKDMRRIEDFGPRIADRILFTMRRQHTDQLQTQKDMAKLHTEMLNDLNTNVMPIPIHDVIFRKLVIM